MIVFLSLDASISYSCSCKEIFFVLDRSDVDVVLVYQEVWSDLKNIEEFVRNNLSVIAIITNDFIKMQNVIIWKDKKSYNSLHINYLYLNFYKTFYLNSVRE